VKQHTSEKLSAVATGGFILMLVLDMVFNFGMFEVPPSFWKFVLLMILVGNLGVMIRHLRNKKGE